MLSDAASRQHYLESPRRDWRAFFDACGDDPVIEEIKVLLDLLDRDSAIVLLTARPERVHHLTEAWLRRYEIRWDVLIMRPWGDYELARDFKQSTVRRAARATGSTCGSRIEDDRRNVEMFRAEGVPVRLLPLRLLRLTSRAASVQSRKLVKSTGMPKSCSRIAVIAVWRSSCFLPRRGADPLHLV